MMLFYSETKKTKYFLDLPPPKGGWIRTVAIWLHAHVCVCLYQQPLTWIFTRSRLSDSTQSNPFIRNYYLIIVAFSRLHFSISLIFIQKKAHLVSRATHFKIRTTTPKNGLITPVTYLK